MGCFSGGFQSSWHCTGSNPSVLAHRVWECQRSQEPVLARGLGCVQLQLGCCRQPGAVGSALGCRWELQPGKPRRDPTAHPSLELLAAGRVPGDKLQARGRRRGQVRWERSWRSPCPQVMGHCLEPGALCPVSVAEPGEAAGSTLMQV